MGFQFAGFAFCLKCGFGFDLCCFDLFCVLILRLVVCLFATILFCVLCVMGLVSSLFVGCII